MPLSVSIADFASVSIFTKRRFLMRDEGAAAVDSDFERPADRANSDNRTAFDPELSPELSPCFQIP